jgi:prevent-host-death family protein
MTEVTVGVRDLKAQLSEYLRHVKAGETVVITEHGRPIAQIMPVTDTTEERIRRLVETGVILWNGERLPPFEPVVTNNSNTLISDIVSELRG